MSTSVIPCNRKLRGGSERLKSYAVTDWGQHMSSLAKSLRLKPEWGLVWIPAWYFWIMPICWQWWSIVWTYSTKAAASHIYTSLLGLWLSRLLSFWMAYGGCYDMSLGTLSHCIPHVMIPARWQKCSWFIKHICTCFLHHLAGHCVVPYPTLDACAICHVCVFVLLCVLWDCDSSVHVQPDFHLSQVYGLLHTAEARGGMHTHNRM